MIYAGIDIGSRAAKVIVMKDGSILSSFIGDTGPESIKTANLAMGKALEGTGISIADIDYIVSTGYGRVLVPFAKENISEISCHAKGINWYFPSVRTILDMGGQDCKAIRCNGEGYVTSFVMNDKCAGGTGRFLEMIADVLNLKLTEIGQLSLTSDNKIPFNTICAVFAKTDAINYMKKGIPKKDILSGLHDAISTRSFNLLKRVTIEKDFAITGGIAKNKGMVAKIQEKVGLQPMLCSDPQLVGALGAALFAAERHKHSSKPSLKAQYGYSDATGEYFISIDTGKCDACGNCINACPAGLFILKLYDDGQNKAAIKEDCIKRISILCPGYQKCSATNKINCQQSCQNEAIYHSW
ncbi:MAG: acyl-CoA dehydratase activase [Chloroflexi bacterium]|nr:acyl-CoA dehydratase activase [Chloroflexota bacterium]